MKNFTLSAEEESGVENRAKAWVKRLEQVLNMDLPFHKVGIAHLTSGLIAPKREDYTAVLNAIPEEEMIRLFSKAAKVGAGIELNKEDMEYKSHEEEAVLRVYKIAKNCGCKFYLGSDSHHLKNFGNAKSIFEKTVDLLGLTEDDKFIIG